MDSRSACIQGVLEVKVKIKGYVIRALLRWHENRFLSRRNVRIATKLAHDGLQVSVHVLKVNVKVKGHVIRALLCWHENRLFSLSNCSIATKLAVDGLQESVAQILGSPISRERLFVGSRR